jgi:hypothetical protein
MRSTLIAPTGRLSERLHGVLTHAVDVGVQPERDPLSW